MSEVPPFLRPLYENDPDLYRVVSQALDLAHSEGALDKKTKVLISMVIDALAAHPEGVEALAREARELGASDAEIAEALRMAFTGGGLPALICGFPAYRRS